MLEIRSLSQYYGEFCALKDISFDLGENEILGIIGQNGAGKTTLINSITGLGGKALGTVRLDGTDILGKRPDTIARLSVARTFQNLRIFRGMTVREHLLVAQNRKLSPGRKLLPNFRNTEDAGVDALREFVDLRRFRDDDAEGLSYGDRRRVEMARALAGSPKLLILDEPGAGMNEQESEVLAAQIREIRARFHTAIILIEHDMSIIRACCERIIVLDHGQKIAEGSFEQIAADREVQRAYLGEDDA